MESAPASGRIIAGKYRLGSPLGQGGVGTVWSATHLELDAPVALKLLKLVSDEAVARFQREARAAAALRSPHVVQILDYGIDGTTPYLVMERLVGETLAETLERNGRLDAATTVRVISHLARAVGRAHEAGIVHRDLKPENVFLVNNDGELVAKVLDFGIAKTPSVSLDAGTRTGAIFGTPYYMSPEQMRDTKGVDGRSDLWALGVIAFECVCGQRPFQGANYGDLVVKICVDPPPVPSSSARVPPGFDAWFARALAREPERRFQTARELAAALRTSLGIAPVENEPTPSIGVPAVSAEEGVMLGRAETMGASSVTLNRGRARTRYWAVVASLSALVAAGSAGVYLKNKSGPLAGASASISGAAPSIAEPARVDDTTPPATGAAPSPPDTPASANAAPPPASVPVRKTPPASRGAPPSAPTCYHSVTGQRCAKCPCK